MPENPATPAAPSVESIITASLDAIRPEGEEREVVEDTRPDDVAIVSGDEPALSDDDPAEVVEKKEPTKKDDKPVEKVVEKKEDEDDFDKVPEKGVDGRTNRIPHPRVKKMVEGAVAKGKATWEKDVLAPEKAKTTEYETRLNRIDKVEHVMFNEQDRFLNMLDTIPGYKEAFERRFGPAKVVPVEVSKDDPEPGPDVRGADGQPVGYSQEGLKALRAWDRRQSVNETTKLVEERLGKRIEPFEKRDQAAANTAAQQRGIADELNAASKWDGFVEHSDVILAAMREDTAAAIRERRPVTPLADLYAKVVPAAMRKKLGEDKAKWREEFMAELKKAPRSTSAGAADRSQSRHAVVKDGPVEVEDIIKAELDKLR